MALKKKDQSLEHITAVLALISYRKLLVEFYEWLYFQVSRKLIRTNRRLSLIILHNNKERNNPTLLGTIIVDIEPIHLV